jgi:hypothetical protein
LLLYRKTSLLEKKGIKDCVAESHKVKKKKPMFGYVIPQKIFYAVEYL